MNEKADKAFKLHNQIVKNEEERRRLLYENSLALLAMQESNLYQDILGDEKAPWSGYLGQVEIFYSRNKVYDMTRVAKKFLVDLKLDYNSIANIPLSRLCAVLSLVKTENIELLLSQAKTLTAKDFDIVLREMKGLVTEDQEHEHNYQHVQHCKICGHRENI